MKIMLLLMYRYRVFWGRVLRIFVHRGPREENCPLCELCSVSVLDERKHMLSNGRGEAGRDRAAVIFSLELVVAN